MNLTDSILFHDHDLLVIDKPSGESFLADRTGQDSLWDKIVAWCRQENRGKPRPVHRLDKGTSGTLVIALSRRAQRSLNQQFNSGRVSKTYIAWLDGTPDPLRATIDLPLCPGRKSRYRIAGPRECIKLQSNTFPPVWILPEGTEFNGKVTYNSLTSYRLIKTEVGRSLVMFRPATGRTHQLRVHASWLGWPIVGDHLYGKPNASSQKGSRLMLHCQKIVVSREWNDNRRLVLRSKHPKDFEIQNHN